MFKLVLNETGLIINMIGYQLSEVFLNKDVTLDKLNIYNEEYYLQEHTDLYEFPEREYFCKIAKFDFYLLYLLNANRLEECLCDLLISIDFLDNNSKQYFLKHMMNYDFRTAFFLSSNNRESIYNIFNCLEYMQNDIIFDLQDFDVYLEHFRRDSNKNENTENILEGIIEYRDKHYSKEEIDAYYDRKDKVAKGIELPTEQEFLRDWIFIRRGDEIEIIGYKGTAPKVKIPSELEDAAKIVKIDGKLVDTEYDKYLIIRACPVYSQSMMYNDNDIEILYLDDSFLDKFESSYYNFNGNIIQIHGVNAKPFDFSLDVFEEADGSPHLMNIRKKTDD